MPNFSFALEPRRSIAFALANRDQGVVTLGVLNPAIALELGTFIRGPKGDPGPGGGSLLSIEAIAVDGVNTITVPVPFIASASRLYINGLRQRVGTFTTSGQVVTLPATLSCVAGDGLSLEYLPS